MSRPRKLSDTEIAAAQVMLNAGAPYKIIMRRFCVSRVTLWRAMLGVMKHNSLILKHHDDSRTEHFAA